MSDLIVPNIICFQTQEKPATVNEVRVLLEGVLTDLCARNFVHAKTTLRACCVYARHCACNLSSSVSNQVVFLHDQKIKIKN